MTAPKIEFARGGAGSRPGQAPRSAVVRRVTSPTLVETAVEELREAILGGRFQPGERLLEPPLAKSLGISRGPLREALHTLERDGLVQSTPRKGRFVQTIDVQTIEDVYSLRTVLETYAVERIVDLASDDELTRLDDALEDIRRTAEAGDPTSLAQGDVAFHDALYELAHHSLLARTWRELVAGKLRLWISKTTMTYEPLREPVQNHAAIVQAIRDRDAARARQEVVTHIADARSRALAILERERMSRERKAPRKRGNRAR